MVKIGVGYGKESCTKIGVSLHDFVFGSIEAGWFLEDDVRDGHLADIVEHGGDPQYVLVFCNLDLGYTAAACPYLVYLNGISGHPVYMRAGLFWIPELRHADHPEDDVPGKLGPLYGNGRIVGKVEDVLFIVF